MHWTVKPPHWKPNKGIGQGEKWGDGARRRIIILCRPLVLTQTPELSAVQRGRCEGQTFSVNWHFVSSGPSLCEGEWKREWASERAGEWSAEREWEGGEKALVLRFVGPCWGCLRFTSYPLLIGLSLPQWKKERIHITPSLPSMLPVTLPTRLIPESARIKRKIFSETRLSPWDHHRGVPHFIDGCFFGGGAAIN